MDAMQIIAHLLAISARTAPKSAGQDFVTIKILQGDDIPKLAQGMIEFGENTGKANFGRDAKNVQVSEAVVLIGLKDAATTGLNCGACGYETCQACQKANRVDVEFQGPQCAFRLLDLGIALGSAVKTAGLLNVDNRIMYRIGVVARHLGFCDWDYVMGIPLSATGKNIYFDR